MITREILESNDDDTTPNPPSENEGSNTDHDVDNGEQPDNGDDTSSNDEDNHSSDDTNGNDEGIEPPYEVDGDILKMIATKLSQIKKITMIQVHNHMKK